MEEDENGNESAISEEEPQTVVEDTTQVRHVYVGTKSEGEQRKDEVGTDESPHTPPQSNYIKVVNIEENIPSGRNSLLAIKKKVKSSLYHKEGRHSRYERFGDKVQDVRRNITFF